MRSPLFIPDQQGNRLPAGTVQGAAEFLRAHDKMASILPAVKRIVALQRDCATALPSMFNACSVLQFESNLLVLSMPNAALAAKLKQQLPKLQYKLLALGWQVSAIRLKVQATQNIEESRTSKQLRLPGLAVSALAALDLALEDSPRNAALKAALGEMLRHHGYATKKVDGENGGKNTSQNKDAQRSL
jgi:hypothetical protein